MYSNIDLSKLFKINSIQLYFIDQNQTKDFILFINLDHDVELNMIEILKSSIINSTTIGYNNMMYSDIELLGLYYLYGSSNIDKNLIGIDMFYNNYIVNIDDDKHTRKYNRNIFILISAYYYGINNYNISNLISKLNQDIFHNTDVLLTSKMIKGYGGVQNTSRQLLKILDLKYNVMILSNNINDNEFNFENDFLDSDIPHILIVKLKKRLI